ncbi:MerR family transcriptional regulator [Nitrospira defluvii]|nr:MerR family transcriptional regulator [Nitrospira defluvii]
MIVYGSKEVCELLDLPYSQLEYWVLVGLAKPIFECDGLKWEKKFREEDLQFMKKVKVLIDQGYLVSRAAEKVRGSQLPEVAW